MDKTNLIDLDCTNVDNYSKLVSPLIPNPVESGDKCAPVICDFEYNNPFDKVLRNITNSDDPFERVYDTAYPTASKLRIVENDKENYTHLVSPIQTPQRIRKSKVLLKNPLFLDISISESTQKSLDVSTNVLQESANATANESNASLQCLSETFMNDWNGSFGVGLEIPLPDISNEQDTINKPSYLSNLSQNLHNNLIIPSINIFNENKSEPSDSSNSILNQAFLHSKSIENARMLKLSTKSSIDSVRNVNSFTLDSLGTSELSNINPISCSSPDIDSGFDRAFLENKTTDSSANTHVYTFNNQRKCLSAQKPPRKEQNLQLLDKTKFISLNNSFAGFNLNNRNQSSSSLDDSVFLEARNLAHAFHTLANDTSELENEISVFAPPWMTDDIDLCDQDTEEIDAIVDVPTQNGVESPKLKVHIEEQKPDVKNDSELKNNSNLLQTLREFMKSDGNEVDERKLEENLLNSLAKALHLNTSGSHTTEDLPQGNDIRENEISAQSNSVRDNTQSSEEVKNDDDIKCVADENKNVKIVPKLKIQSLGLSTAPAKNLKVKNDKITTAKGPLKAVIPLTNMAKTRRSVAPKVVDSTPSKNTLSVFQIKRTSTPNESKIKPPIAQSTPEISKINNNETDSGTPVKKRSFLYSLSPLARPASTTDLSGESSLNKSLSPRNISDSMPSNLNKSGSTLVKHGSNSSIPTMKSNTSCRRNSVSEKPDRSVLNRSYENKPARPSLLKRSSSFQNKSTAQSSKAIPDNNNVYKKFVPGMKLKLSNLGKK